MEIHPTSAQLIIVDHLHHPTVRLFPPTDLYPSLYLYPPSCTFLLHQLRRPVQQRLRLPQL